MKSIEITEHSQVSDARRQVESLITAAGMPEKDRDRTALLCTELGTNLIKHTARGGQLIVQTILEAESVGVEIYSIDSGNGMDASECLIDGFSSAGTFGTGLGAIKRLADEFNIYSQTGIGSVVQARVWSEGKQRSEFDIGGVNVPKKGELISGDKALIVKTNGVIYCLLVDGLGHGIEAAEAAALAARRFRENISLDTQPMLKLIHSSLRGTRGAVGAVARIDLSKKTVSYCGLGNIEGIIVSGASRKHLVSLNGTLGYEAHRFTEFQLPWTPGSTLVMHTDGLSSKTFNSLDEVENKPAAMIAGWLYKQHAKDHDDATVLVLKQQRRQ